MTTASINRYWSTEDQKHSDIPVAVKSGDFVFTSTVYPVDAGSRVAEHDAPPRVHAGSPISWQTQTAFDRLEEALEAAGSSVSHVVRCDVALADARDFYEFNLIWKQRFGAAPPARLAFVVGEKFVAEGALVGMHAVGLAKNSQTNREVIVAPDALDSLAAEGAAQAVRAGDYVFTTALPAYSSYECGLVEVKDRLLSVAAVQSTSVMGNLAKVLVAAGTSLENTVKAQNFMVDRADWKDINSVWGRFMGPIPSPRSSIAVRGLVAAGARAMCSAVAVRPSQGNVKEALHSGVGFEVSEIGYNFSPAVTTRDWISLAGHLAFDYATFTNIPGPSKSVHLFSEIELQVDAIMVDRLRILEQNGAAATDVLEAKVYLKYPRQDYSGFLRAWRCWFPDPGLSPALQVIPVDNLNYDGTIVEIELLAARPFVPN
jgi:enamine deaminase RidA (YjgF/YER057c/UK114 family)